MDFGNTETPSMHCRLGNATVAAGFPRGKRPKFPMGEIPMGQCSYKKKEKKINEAKIGLAEFLAAGKAAEAMF